MIFKLTCAVDLLDLKLDLFHAHDEFVNHEESETRRYLDKSGVIFT